MPPFSVNPRLVISIAVAAAGTVAILCPATAQPQTVEQVAQTIVAQHNANAKALLDDMTVSTSAKAVGKNVRLKYVLRVKKGLPSAKLREFADETRREIEPRACHVNSNNEAFKRGLYYTFTYVNTYDEKLAEFNIDKAICADRK